MGSVSVVVVGAGVAGLASADRLMSESRPDLTINVTVLEGNDRPGGRICTHVFGDEIVELGATYLHGTVNNPLYDLLQHFRSAAVTRSSSSPSEMTIPRRGSGEGLIPRKRLFQTKGHSIDSFLVHEANALYNRLLDECNQMVLNPFPPPCLDVGSYMKMGLKEYMSSERLPRQLEHRHLVESIFNYRMTEETSTSGCDSMDEVSLHWFGDYRVLCGGNRHVDEGMNVLVDELVAKLPEDCICFNSIVDKICWSKDTTSKQKPVTVYTRCGKSYEADHVIFTGSLGVLKHRGLDNSFSGLFDPSLPEEKQSAINRLGMDAVEKVFVRFERRFWPEQCSGYNFCWPIQDKSSKFYNDTDFSWMKKVDGLRSIRRYSDSPVMSGWITGKEAVKMTSESSHALNQKFHDLMEYFVHQMDIPEVVEVLHTDWCRNELFQGAYSYPAVGCSPKDFDTLAQPLPPPSSSTNDLKISPLQLLFAGEATHRNYYSTLHGAYLTGIREADRIISLYEHSTDAS
ncbi:peroxisomal N(1)-acetyl-spermine/spermidine oxidase-like [Corticium candelabrum]|uniref:peroxisomal N(1)-acetyl-spermine/spermidine oxidase-like n=1 Tax=Corticium candelabrum TaxID=121492 RepID=UPI002E25953B|nr:peroxisomal N(1)-acetyl-spermine/spermidine oxidase-like [Corticium candelabrum]